MWYPLLYRAGYVATLLLPRAISYLIACRLADLYSAVASKDRAAVRNNLEAILGAGQVSRTQVRAVFRNFAMYLVDFFRFHRLTVEGLSGWVKVEGLDWMRRALEGKRGAIGLTAHLGNYELAGAVLALLGLPISAVVFTHQNPSVDAFFSRQRTRVGVKGIPVHRENQRQLFETALEALGRNDILGLVGDRDFFGHGLPLPFFGKSLQVPRGPAAFSIRTGAPIVPCFLVRETDGKYRFVMEPPILPPQGADRETAVRKVTEECLAVMTRYIRRYPTQWYMFQEFWKQGAAVVI